MSTQEPSLDSTPFWEAPHTSEKPIDLLVFGSNFVRRWPLFILLTLFGGLLALGISFLLTPRYTAQAVFLPPVQQHPATDNPLSLLIRAPSSSVYSGLLLSDSVLSDVVAATNIEPVFKAKDIQDARAGLKAITQVTVGGDDFVTLKVTYKDPKLAQQIASNYLKALQRLETRLSVDQASQQRLESQTQLDQEKNALQAAETALEKAQEASGVVLPQNQTLSGLSAIDVTRASIRANQVALASLLQSRTEQAPEVVRLRSEIAAQQAQLQRLESGGATAPGSGLAAGQAPAVNLRFVQLEREVRYHQVLFDVMVREFQAAKIQESSSAPGVQIVDYPEVPIHPSWPNHRVLGLAGALLGFFFSLFLTFTQDRIRVLRVDPARSQSLRTFRFSMTNPTFRP